MLPFIRDESPEKGVVVSNFRTRTRLLSGLQGRKHRFPHELCGKICYCSWPRFPEDGRISPICPTPCALSRTSNISGISRKWILSKKPFSRRPIFPARGLLPISVCVYIYIYAGELVLVPLFGLSRVSFGTTSRVRNSTTSWGAHFRTTKIGFLRIFVTNFGAN